MSLDLVYLIGAPGAGKSTLARRLVDGIPLDVVDQPIAHEADPTGHLVMPGRPPTADRPFGGTDRLGMAVARTAEAWIASTPAPLVLGEGDRLAYSRFFDVALSAGYRLTLVYLVVNPDEAARRRAERAERLGSKLQSASWVRGRASKAAGLATSYGAVPVEADGGSPNMIAVNAVAAVPHLADALDPLRR